MSPVKEPNYFASEIRLGNVGSQWQDWAQRENDSLQRYLHGPMQEKRFGGIVSSWSDYLKPFQNVRGHGSHKGRPDSSASAKSGKSQGLARQSTDKPCLGWGICAETSTFFTSP